ncbi:unnamed protein product [Effrenium voratum]|uniref:AB hydrolase-1 domain-containing protein n=1 Tax=Effrenium voratum TaxID=2562239 RepID=A0AA36JKL8_9DINO|nr:unnamed protein product [Effrenium voratum]
MCAPLYLRFSGIFALLCSLWGAGGQHCAWLGRGLVLAVLLRRLFRAWGGWPSRALRGPSGALAPTVDGLHRRFAELYLDGKAEEGEAAVLGAQQRVELNGQRVAFWDVGDGEGAVLVCNGLGARVMTWAPLLSALGASWAKRRLVIFDYPGQFDSQPLVGDISVERSAADAYRLAQHLKLQRVMLLCWSTGVQVGLQLALDHPELVEAMVLIQGTTGEAMSALLQPLCPMPGVPSLLRLGLRVAPAAMRRPRPLMEAALRRYRGFFEALGSCVLWFFGSDLIPAVGVRYVADRTR